MIRIGNAIATIAGLAMLLLIAQTARAQMSNQVSPQASERHRNNLTGGLALPLAGPSDRADSPHPLSREGHLPPPGGVRAFLLSELIFHDCHAAGTASRVQRNSVPSTQMRCRMTASR